MWAVKIWDSQLKEQKYFGGLEDLTEKKRRDMEWFETVNVSLKTIIAKQQLMQVSEYRSNEWSCFGASHMRNMALERIMRKSARKLLEFLSGGYKRKLKMQMLEVRCLNIKCWEGSAGDAPSVEREIVLMFQTEINCQKSEQTKVVKLGKKSMS